MTHWLTEKPGSPGEYTPHYSNSPVLAGLSVSMDAAGRMQIGPGIQSVEVHAGNGFHSLYGGLTLTAFTPPFNGTWLSWRILAPWNSDTNITLDLYKDTYANWPPDASDSICGAELPVLSSGRKSEATINPLEWTVDFDAGDTFLVRVVSTADPGPLGIIFSLTYKRR